MIEYEIFTRFRFVIHQQLTWRIWLLQIIPRIKLFPYCFIYGIGCILSFKRQPTSETNIFFIIQIMTNEIQNCFIWSNVCLFLSIYSFGGRYVNVEINTSDWVHPTRNSFISALILNILQTIFLYIFVFFLFPALLSFLNYAINTFLTITYFAMINLNHIPPQVKGVGP